MTPYAQLPTNNPEEFMRTVGLSHEDLMPQPPWSLMFRSSPSNALSKTRKCTTLEKKRHTVKVQLVICALPLAILSLMVGKGRQHDFSVFKDSRLLLHRDALLLADSG